VTGKLVGKLPPLATAVVALAVATMIWLGVWQLGRAGEKEALLELYSTAPSLPPIAFPTGPMREPPLFRRAEGFCLQPLSRNAVAGANGSGEPGYVHIVNCRTGAEGPGMAVELGWSKDPRAQLRWAGGQVSGLIVPDRQHRIRLHSDRPATGLEPSRAPSQESIPNNHRLYAVQWFLFAAIALLIYVLALRKRWKKGELE
jgi:cytochrome oxidase assembly protein ShyY1